MYESHKLLLQLVFRASTLQPVCYSTDWPPLSLINGDVIGSNERSYKYTGIDIKAIVKYIILVSLKPLYTLKFLMYLLKNYCQIIAIIVCIPNIYISKKNWHLEYKEYSLYSV